MLTQTTCRIFHSFFLSLFIPTAFHNSEMLNRAKISPNPLLFKIVYEFDSSTSKTIEKKEKKSIPMKNKDTIEKRRNVLKAINCPS